MKEPLGFLGGVLLVWISGICIGLMIADMMHFYSDNPCSAQVGELQGTQPSPAEPSATVEMER